MSARTPGKIEHVEEDDNRYPRLTARKHARLFNMSRRTLRKLLHIVPPVQASNDLQTKPE